MVKPNPLFDTIIKKTSHKDDVISSCRFTRR